MTLLTTLLWPALAGSLLLGAGIGWLTGLPRTRVARGSALALALATILSGSLAVAGLIPGRAGSWIEDAALMLGAYLTGAALAAAITHRAAAPA